VSNDNVVKLIQPGAFDDQLTEILRQGARSLLAQAVEAEVADFLTKHGELRTEDGRQRIVRHGHLPEREVMTGIGPVVVRQPRVRDREAAAGDPGRICFTPAILPPYMRRSKSIETLLPILYLKGISTGDFSEALAALLGKDAAGLSPAAIARLKDGWVDEHDAWQKRDLSMKRYVYVWADGIHLQARLEDEKQCILVLIGATPEGRKELVGFTDGSRESAQDWRDLLLDLKRRGLDVRPELLTGILHQFRHAAPLRAKSKNPFLSQIVRSAFESLRSAVGGRHGGPSRSKRKEHSGLSPTTCRASPTNSSEVPAEEGGAGPRNDPAPEVDRDWGPIASAIRIVG
jgi:putative transposase